ncbi:MAG: lipoate--protein ligase family protein [Coriobacteriia bacterium]|nr:lipoate--protein ligase family protein [Coriobacteriia bacterium]
MTPIWRLLIDEQPMDGAWNMALDRSIQLERQAGRVPPTLRLYGWLRPTITLGRFQDAAGVDRDECRLAGVDVVRRFTGGRGVLHDDEVTYSMVAAVDDGIPQGTAVSYRLLCGVLVEAYKILGVAAALTARSRGESASAACYLHATQADLSLGAQKLSGSAQVWSGDTVLQHGSFVISRNVDLESRLFRLDSEAATALAAQTVTIEQARGDRPSHANITSAVADGLRSALGVHAEAGTLTQSEIELAHSLLPEVHPDAALRRGRRLG